MVSGIMPTSFLIKDILNLPELKSTEGMRISDVQLIQCSASEVNQLCKGLPEGTVKQIKKRRRTLKNRKYATSSRKRRLETTKQLEIEVQNLRQEVIRLKKHILAGVITQFCLISDIIIITL